ncbi:MAG: IclR family transcriptional regulator, acetate operon repressor [Solirubrobacteraceae bacterium]|nr:IclR family transcriptional regulator, acetate operon repressor [Solirubrobacteraceae bacterium]
MQILERLVAIIEAVAPRAGGAGLAEIAKATGLAPATAHRLLSALEQEHLLEREPESKRYRPGIGLLRIAGSLRHPAGSEVDTALVALRDRWQECFYLTELVHDGIVSVRSVTTNDPNRMSVSVPVGRRMGPHASASGKAIMAELDREQRHQVVAAAGGLAALTPFTITDEDALERDLDASRSRGHAVCDQETEIGVAALAVPVRGDEGVRQSLGVIGPRERVLRARDEGLVDDLLISARFLSPVAAPVDAVALEAPR